MKDITGQVFNRLTAIKPHHKDKYGSWYWIFLCKCGKETVAKSSSVFSGHTKSCGCYHIECAIKHVINLNTTHGLAHSRFYNIWSTMKARCGNKNQKNYYLYGGRGILVIKRWENFENFKSDMHESYLLHVEVFGESQTSLDRKNNNLGYSKENCRWATRKEQNRNARSNHAITYQGATRCISEWADVYKMSPRILGQRIRRNWSFQRAINTGI